MISTANAHTHCSTRVLSVVKLELSCGFSGHIEAQCMKEEFSQIGVTILRAYNRGKHLTNKWISAMLLLQSRESQWDPALLKAWTQHRSTLTLLNAPSRTIPGEATPRPRPPTLRAHPGSMATPSFCALSGVALLYAPSSLIFLTFSCSLPNIKIGFTTDDVENQTSH